MIAIAQLHVGRDGHPVATAGVHSLVFTIGRQPSSNLVLPDADVSPRHAEIRVEPEGVVLTDVGSDTGTALDGVRLLPMQPALLGESAAIRIGPYDILYRVQPALEGETSPASQEQVPARQVDGDTDTAATTSAGLPASTADAAGFGLNVSTGRYLEYLPVIFHHSDFLRRFLGIFETIWEPLEQRQDHIAMYFSPRTCPASWLPWFAGWFGIELQAHWPESRIRALIAEAADLYRWRGTAYGLGRMLEVCTGLKSEISESPTDRFVFRVAVEIPADAPPDIVETIDALIMAHKPAHAGYVLEVKP
jgi:phage tail-like protein